MTQKIININDLTDSKEMLEAKEPNFIIVFIYFAVILIIGLFIWMWFGELDITIKATGILRPAKKVSILRNITGGKVKEINYYEGEKVYKGDILYKLDSTNLIIKEESLQKEKDKLEKDLEMLNILKDSIVNGESLFRTVEDKYYNRLLVFKYKYERLTLEYTRAKERYDNEKKLPPAATTRNKLAELETNYIVSKLTRDEYKSETLVAIKNEIDNEKERLDEIHKSLQEIEIGKDLNIGEAPINGVVQVLQEFNVGDYIPEGMKILRIIPGNDSDYVVEITAQNKDISQLEVGQKVKYRFLAFPYKEYGTLSGEISKISTDALINQEENMAYKIESSTNDTILYNKKGEPRSIKPGMLCEVRVVVRKKRLIYFILEKLDFLS